MAQLKIIDNFDGSFTLEAEVKLALFQLLSNEGFLEQVARETQSEGVEFTELIFQPVPYSQNTPKGMPPLFEQYYESPEHVIINVPPNFMFQAKVFSPSRLCAIYRRIS
ncbi:MAG: hypothetical protein HC851_13305 [Acaryochloris sp. RU_4_1]|nr:hypothetical protein [Acaryochloris sp. RU_4_1]NJN38545.1 hypothetical protein [Acaryochloridaceae cyanobacterium CSU_3_4]NJR55279.1 hypothetical protein [Acaryochloris sp. CRU_2_0]